MGKQKESRIHKYLYEDTTADRFLMLPPELFESPAFQELSHAGRLFYILLATHKETWAQQTLLQKVLADYNQILNLGMTKEDIENEALPNKKARGRHDYFVAPSQYIADNYGYSMSYITKLKKELMDKGFIKAVYGQKGKYNGWNQNETVYQFISDWKRKDSKE